MSDAWLANVKVGDKLAMCPASYSDRYFIVTVEGLTKTLIRTSSGEFKRANGHSSRFGPYLLELTPERRALVLRRRRIDRLSAVKWSELTDEQLRAACLALAEVKP